MKTLKTLALALAVTFTLAATSHAFVWVTARVDKAGPVSPDQILVSLSDMDPAAPLFTNRWFVADDPIKKEILATALTAICTNKRVLVMLDDTVKMSTILRMYLNKNPE